MRRLFIVIFLAMLFFFSGAVLLVSPTPSASTPKQSVQQSGAFLGFDLNEYPGDDVLPMLRKTFSFTSYWIGPPSGEKKSTWSGKRELLKSLGFGFVVLFNARESRALKSGADGQQKGVVDAESAAKLAAQEGFAKGTVIFLDIEEGGRLPMIYHEYLQKWFEGLAMVGYRAGVYCSAIPVKEGEGVSITTAKDIQDHAGSREIVYWVYNDTCPPSPGCAFSANALLPLRSGFASASVWQYAQSPRRKEFTAQCPEKYAADGNCYAPGDIGHKWFLDANVAYSADPSSAK